MVIVEIITLKIYSNKWEMNTELRLSDKYFILQCFNNYILL